MKTKLKQLNNEVNRLLKESNKLNERAEKLEIKAGKLIDLLIEHDPEQLMQVTRNMMQPYKQVS